MDDEDEDLDEEGTLAPARGAVAGRLAAGGAGAAAGRGPRPASATGDLEEPLA